ncbi:AAA family ATPase [bacterium]|nr:AAA family ATPase [bacterium]
MFINRHEELARLEERYTSDKAELFVLYGRRRVGKTELLREFCRSKPNLFFVATLSSDADQLAAFSQQIWQYTHDSVSGDFTFPSWEAAFSALIDLPGRPIVIIDEITYLIAGNKSIPSILQKVWDMQLSRSNLFLVLCGSYIGMMEREILDYQAPLYGRRTGSELLPPLELPAIALFFPELLPIQQIETWSVLGGMPYYLSLFRNSQDLFAGVKAHILHAKGTLYDEPLLLLMEELREPRNYFSILRAIAGGHTRLNEIAQSAGVGDVRTTGRYLDILRQLRVVRRLTPATERQPEKSKKGIYQIEDPFLNFWFRFVHPHRGSLDLGLVDAVFSTRVEPVFDSFVGHAFEETARAYIARLARMGKLPFLLERVGRWWNNSEEIDVVAVSDIDNAILIGECKWSTKPVGLNILADLQRKAQILLGEERRDRVVYALFSKNGFTPELTTVAQTEGILLAEPADLVAQSPTPRY